MNNSAKPGLVRLAVLTDLHYGERGPDPRRRGDIGHILLERAVRRLNGLVRPDVVLVLGDLLDVGDAADAEERLLLLKRILDKLKAPWLAIPGNHDPDPECFYRVFPRPGAWEDIAGVRFLAFVDEEAPGYNATRSAADIARIRMARADYDGPLVALQHVCLFPPERGRLTPYNYTNAAELIAAMKAAGVALSVSGHHHPGAADCHDEGLTFVNAPGLCESPFPILEITIAGAQVTTRRHELAMPTALKLVDSHLHTQLAYCSENMDVQQTVALAETFGLAGLIFTEHSGQLYFDRKAYWASAWLPTGIEAAKDADNRVADYLALKQAYESDFARFSLEADCDARGRLVVQAEDRRHFLPPVGAIHALPGLSREVPPGPKECETFLAMVDGMGREGIPQLAHPMRVFGRAGWPAPTELFAPTAKLLRQYGVAAEINFHTHLPPVAFVRTCLSHGVKFAFASDAHNLAEVGDFAYHIAILREAGYDGDLADILKAR